MLIAQISDTHISEDDGFMERTYETAACLRRAVDHLIQLPVKPDLVMVTGDCVDTGTDWEYARFRELLQPLTMPVHVIPGNHDDRTRMRTVFGAQGAQAMDGFVQYVVDIDPLRLIALDTNIPGAPGGKLCAQRLDWLEARLAEVPDRPTVIFMHHPPFATGMKVMDGMGLADADAFGAVVARHPQIERVLAGHIHCTLQRRFHGTIAASCPSTATQIQLDLAHPERLSVSREGAACLLHSWSEETGLLTSVSEISGPRPVDILFDGEKWTV
ncbi:MAG: phosphodiesterase [Rhodospirillaceae bacterium]|nr:phosphodiesterase [Rhodospirillaceae bacterium]MDD9915542.1 phosphodiesterase [Rhodospirillaceae bacterium]MDD9930095.1 phosphodiesterase [Rhodospirillaceae bacterium]